MAGEGEKGEKEDNSWQSGEGWCGAGVDSLLPENEKSLNSSSWKILNRKVLLWQACLCKVAAFDKCDTAKDLMWAPPFWRCNHFFDLLRSHLIFSARPIPWHVKIAPRARFHMRGLITQSMCQALEWWWFHIALLHAVVHNSFDVLPFGADQGSCAYKCLCYNFLNCREKCRK